jgi:hypothetical protein
MSENSDLQALASPSPYFQDKFSALPEEDRVRLTRGMVVDFALLSGLWAWNDDLTPGAVICGVRYVHLLCLLTLVKDVWEILFPSSNVCKMAAVALDWDRAFGYGFKDDSAGEVNQEHARWIEVDEKGSIAPPWRPFDMF